MKKVHKLKVSLNEISRMKKLAGLLTEDEGMEGNAKTPLAQEYIEKYKEYESVILSAERKYEDCGKGAPRSQAENDKNTSKLERMISGYDYYPTTGMSRENDVMTEEKSFIVFNTRKEGGFKKRMEGIARQFEQDSILHGDADGTYSFENTSDCPDAWPAKGQTVAAGKPVFGKKSAYGYTRMEDGSIFSMQ